MNITELKFLLKKYQLTPNKIRGQNFLISDDVLEDIIRASDLKKSDQVLEVGAGLGALTSRLAQSAGRVVALEIDQNFRPALDNLQKINSNLDIIWQDILSVKDSDLKNWFKDKKYKIIANIPYYLTGKFLQKFLTGAHQPESMTLMVQAEVADRILAQDKKQSLLSLAVAFYGQAGLLRRVESLDFYPAPKVNSAVVQIKNIKAWSYRQPEKKTWSLIHAGFSHKRKKLINNLGTALKIDKNKLVEVLVKCNLEPNIRAERLTKDDWLKLTLFLDDFVL